MGFGFDDNNDIKIAQSEQLDAFNRLRTSNPTILYAARFDKGIKSFLFSDSTATGGTVTRNTNTSSIDLAVTAASGSSALRQSKEYVNYTPGQSYMGFFTGKFGTAKANCVQRIGLFDNNNGVFFELDGTTLNVVVRSSTSGSPSDTATSQSSWNIDHLNGSGESGITLDLTKQQIFIIDFQWLGSGRIRFGFAINGKTYICHEVLNSNVLDVPWSQTATLPVRFEISNSAATSGSTTLRFTCASILREGENNNFVSTHVARRSSDLSINTTLVPVLSVRLKSTFIRANLLPYLINVFTTSLDLIEWVIVLNPSLTGASWTSAGTNAIFEYDQSATALTGGEQILAVYTSDEQSINLDLENSYQRILADISGTSDILTVSARSLSGAASVISNIVCKEIY